MKNMILIAASLLMVGSLASASSSQMESKACDHMIVQTLESMVGDKPESLSALSMLALDIAEYDGQSKVISKSKGDDRAQAEQAQNDTWQDINYQLAIVKSAQPKTAKALAKACNIPQ